MAPVNRKQRIRYKSIFMTRGVVDLCTSLLWLPFNVSAHATMFHAYPGERRDLQWVTVTLTSIATILLISRISLTIKNRGWLGLEDGFVIAANVSAHIRATRSDTDGDQVCLIVFAVCVYIATLHGFGMPKAAIPKFGGNYIEAMKVSWTKSVSPPYS